MISNDLSISLTSEKDIIYSGFKLHKNGLQAIGTPSFEQWQECGEFIKKSNGAVHFWIGDWLNYGEQKYGEMYTQVLDETQFDYGTLRNDKYLTSRVPLSLRSDNLTRGHALEIASLEPLEIETWANFIEKTPITVSDLKKEILAEKKRKLGTPKLPDGKYNVIYADPPWDIGSMVLDKWESPLEDKYPTMTEEELQKLDVPKLSADNCVLFMWTTLSTLPEALRLMEHWGFKYHITITWDKGNGWSMSGFHRKTELVLVGYKGVLSEVVKQEGEYIPTVFAEAKTTHSTKPEKMYQLIEDRTIGKKVELFARIKRDGWEVFGNQL
jgi:N6-adenosine-specific RNA methylase IME4